MPYYCREVRVCTMTRLLLLFLRAYQLLVSPILPADTCRFHPSCSEYAIQVISKYGPLRGSWLAVKRVGKCHPFHPGGYDPA
jgi:hypothetical protein